MRGTDPTADMTRLLPPEVVQALTANNVTAATLVFYVADTDGNPTRATSAVPVTRQ